MSKSTSLRLTPVDIRAHRSPSGLTPGNRDTELLKQVLISNAESAMSGGENSPPADRLLEEPAEEETAFSLHGDDGAAPQPSESDPPRTPPRNTRAVITGATPHRKSSHDSEAAFRLIREVKAAVNVELTDAWVEEGVSLPFKAHLEATADKEYPDLDRQAAEWLQTYAGYDSATQQWSKIPVKTTKEKDLYDPIAKIMADILKHFGNQKQSQGGHVIKRRKVKKTDRIVMSHNPDDAAPETALKTEPDISLLGTGPAATKETDFLEEPSYSQAASLWEVKVARQFGRAERDQVAVYAREVFIQQSNRRHVFIPFMTAKEIRVLRFDRAGCYYSKRINFHTDALFFVKLVVLLSSFNEELLGFDTSIYWKDGQRFMKMTPPELFNGATGCWEVNTKELVFALADEPVFSRRTIRSRGTVCWSAEYEGRQYIVKDYWRAHGRARESEFLKDLADVDGVGQMFTFADDRESIKAQRGFEDGATMVSDSGSRPVLDRWFMRLVLLKYGGTLETASSPRQLLCAVRDIVKGHSHSLVRKGILHRDISFSNLLLSPYPGSCGVVIDWDLAKRMEELTRGHITEGDSRTGTRAYQSVKVLNGSSRLGHHDNMDDIESVLYVLNFVLYGHDTAGNRLGDEALGLIFEWEDPLARPTALSTTKEHFLQTRGRLMLTRYTGPEKPVLVALMKDLRLFFAARIATIGDALDVDGPVAFPAYSEAQAAKEYDDFVRILSAAIDQLPVSAPVPPSPCGSKKRGRSDDEEPTDFAPAQKKVTPSKPSLKSAQAAASGEGSRRALPQRTAAMPSYHELSDSDGSGAGDSSRSPSPTAYIGKDDMEWAPPGGRRRSGPGRRRG